MKKSLFFLFFFICFSVSIDFSDHSHLLFAKGEKGGITGQVRFLGVPPKNQDFIVNVNSEICGKNIQVQDFVYNGQNHGMKNVFVSLKSKLGTVSFLPQPVSITLDNHKCQIDPAVIGVEMNQTINIKNSDPIFHALQFHNKDNFLFNVALPQGGAIVKKKIEQEGIVQVRCSVHPFMQGLIYVADTPYFTLTDQNGSFRMNELDPGKYLIKVWHKSLKPVEKEIEIHPGQILNLLLELEKSEAN